MSLVKRPLFGQGSWQCFELAPQDAPRLQSFFEANPEYFDLVKKNPQAASWLALGRNVQFVLGETIYEIYE